MSFDPYYQWLGIPPEEQPPHHYRLLGIKPLEENLDVIETAADRQMLHLRTYQSGKHAEASQALLNEIAAAKITLLDPMKKAAYDTELQAKQGEAKQAERKQTLAVRRLPVATLLPSAPPPDAPPFPLAVPSISHTSAARKSNSSLLFIAAGGVALVLIAGIVAAFLTAGDESVAAVAPDDAARTGHEPPASEPLSTTSNPPAIVPPLPPVVPIDDEPQDVPLPTTPSEEQPADESPAASESAEPPTTDEPRGDISTLLDEPPAATKLPVPDKAAREAKRQEIQQIFPIAQAKTIEAKAALAAQLLRTAGEAKDDPAAQFALLNLAREQAAEAGNLTLAFEAIDLLAEKFDFDADAVRVTSVQQASKAVVPPAAKRELIVTGMNLVEQLAAANRFDEADALSNRMLTLTRTLRDNELTKSIVERRRALGEQIAIFRRVQTAFDTLKKSPNDADASIAIGRYLSFVKQDWKAGLKHLAKGRDPALAAAAQSELAVPETTVGREKLADAWWAAADSQKDVATQDICRARSAYWYRQIVGDLNGLAKVKAENRIADVAANARLEDRSARRIPKEAVQFNGHYYLAIAQYRVDWEQARKLCEEMGGHLATINSQEEFAVLKELVGPETNNLWIGARQIEGRWLWIDGTEMDDALWFKAPARREGFDFVYINGVGSIWNNASPWDTIPGYICEWEQRQGDAKQRSYLHRDIESKVSFLDWRNKTWGNDARSDFKVIEIAEGYRVVCHSDSGYVHRRFLFPQVDVNRSKLIALFTMEAGTSEVGLLRRDFNPGGASTAELFRFQPGEKYRIELWIDAGQTRCVVNGRSLQLEGVPGDIFGFALERNASILFHELYFENLVK